MPLPEAMRRLKNRFEKFGIETWWNKRISELSKGMAQKVQFIITILHEPELLIFDEPFSGFDPINANLLKNEILELKDRGTTVIFSTHNMASVEEICDHITLINRSKNILSGSVDEIRRRYGDRTYRIDFTGDASALYAWLSDRWETGEPQFAPVGYTIRLRLPGPDAVREVLNEMNRRAEVHNFAEEIPGMNDIFIRAVEGRL